MFFKQPTIINDNGVLLIIIYFQGAPVFHEKKNNVVDNNWAREGRCDTHSMTIFLELFNFF
jgi:hypothetical protein